MFSQVPGVTHLLQVRPAFVLGMALLLNACSGGFEGTYQDELGVTRYEFKADGTVYMSAMGATIGGDYVLEDDEITVKGPNGRLLLRIEDNKLLGPMGLVLHPVRGS